MAIGEFALATASGLTVGVIVAALMRWPRRWFDDPLEINARSLATPFVAYLAVSVVYGSESSPWSSLR
jgi:NhaP-type Na+/H+ or K+/H+ antiporter